MVLEGIEDDIDQPLLKELLTKIGVSNIEDIKLYIYSSKAPKSIGVARIAFASHLATKAAFRKIQRSRVLGNAVKLHLDPTGLCLLKIFSFLQENNFKNF